MPTRLCRDCKGEYVTFSNLQTRCPKCQREHKPQKKQKPIAQKGKKTLQYEKWLMLIAKPHLIRVYGNQCAWCGRSKQHLDMIGIPLDAHHIKGRGSHPKLIMEISNLTLLCRVCHGKVHEGNNNR